MAIIKDLTGQRFGRLVVIALDGKTSNGNAKWLCQCDCGLIVEVMGKNLRDGCTKSCGCLHNELARETCRENGKKNRKKKLEE